MRRIEYLKKEVEKEFFMIKSVSFFLACSLLTQVASASDSIATTLESCPFQASVTFKQALEPFSIQLSGMQYFRDDAPDVIVSDRYPDYIFYSFGGKKFFVAIEAAIMSRFPFMFLSTDSTSSNADSFRCWLEF